MEPSLGMNFNDVLGTIPSVSSFLADPLQRNSEYKKKGNGIGDKRALRLHRRSIDQRKMRDATLLRQRGIDAMSPLKEVQNVTEKIAPSQKKPTSNRSARPQSQSSDMKDRLKKWKEEKELKKKLQRQKQAKPMFKVHHVQYEKPPFAATQAKKTSKPKPAAVASRATRSSARLNSKPTTAPVSTRQTRLRQKEQPAATATTRTTRTTRRTASQSSDSEQVKPVRRSTRATRASARAAQKQKEETKPTTKRNASRTKKQQEQEKVEEPEPPKTQNPFTCTQTTVNFERGEPSTSFLQGPSFAPVDFKFDFTIDLARDSPKTPDRRRCSSTPLNAKTKIPTPQGVSTIRKSGNKPSVAPINVPVLSLSSSTSIGPVTPAITSETYAIPQKSTPANAESQGSSVEEGDIGQVDMETEESAGEKDDDVVESKAPLVEMSEAPNTTDQGYEREILPEVMKTEKAESTEERKTQEAMDEKEVPAKIMDEEKPNSVAELVTQDAAEVPAEIVMKEGKPNSVAQPETQDMGEVAVEIVTEEQNVEQPETQADEIPAGNGGTATSEVAVNAKQDTATETKQDLAVSEAKEEEKDVPYFRRLLVSETTKLTDLWQSVMDESSLTEEVLGEIRSTTGKAQLLMAQRFKQFSGLVDDCEFDRGEKKTHCTDLIGFWEMVAYQVEDVEKMFADLDKLKANNWVKEVKVKPKVKKAVKKSKASAASKKAAADRVAARQRLLAAKAAMKAKATRSKDNEKVVFEGGFFKVESPVKSPKVHCLAGSPLGAAFLRRTNTTPGSRQGTPLLRRTGNTPGSKPGSRQGTPRPQTFIPSKPRLSLQLQAALCTPISKLVLTEADERAPSSARSTRSRQGTPVSVVKPMNASCTPSSLSLSPENEVPSIPQARTPVVTKHRESVAHPLIPGIASPHITADSNSNNMFDAAPSIFTPPTKTAPPTTSTSPVPTVNDLICLDSPTSSSLAPPLPLQTSSQDPTTGSVQCFAAINASTDMKDLLGTDVVMSPVRRSVRLRHTSSQMTVDTLAEMPEDVDYGYQPNVSLL